jgi:GR25 family glycosyltransferase involved in LPS biosynthesis
MPINNIRDIANVYYINLSERVDRKENVEEQLSQINIKGTRFDAIKNARGAVGCCLSHIGCLEIAVENNYDHVLICEDDILFLDSEKWLHQFNTFLESHKTWDVILLGGNNVGPYKEMDETSVKVNKCQTTTAYLINGQEYIKTILNQFRYALRNNLPVDVSWFDLQKKDNWYLIIPLTVVQREDYSDIEKKNVNYVREMMDLKHGHEKR